MEVKEGYKNTEVGVIPEDWEVKDFGDLVHYIKGFAFKSKDYTNSGIRIIRVSDTSFDSIKDENPIYIDAKRANEFRKWKLEEYDLIFSTVGSKPPMYDSLVGKAILIQEKYSGALLNQNAVLIRAKKKTKYIQNFILNHFRTNRYLQYIEEIFRGNANQASITLVDLFKYKIPLPTSTEQTAIATVLSDTDNLIQALEKKIAKKELIKKGAMQQLLEPKEGWEVNTMGDIGESIIGLTYSPNDVDSVGTLVLRSSNIQNNQLAFHDNVYVNMKLPSRVIVEENDILICVRNGSKRLIGKCTLIKKKIAGSAFGAFMTVYRSQYSKFIVHVFQSDYIQKQIDEIMGATINQITNKDLASFIVPFPPINEQNHIAQILSDIDNEIESLQEKLSKYKQLKQGLMQELLTGRIRLV